MDTTRVRQTHQAILNLRRALEEVEPSARALYEAALAGHEAKMAKQLGLKETFAEWFAKKTKAEQDEFDDLMKHPRGTTAKVILAVKKGGYKAGRELQRKLRGK